MTPADADDIRSRAVRALARNRVPGYNFAGLFLNLVCHRFQPGAVTFEMAGGPHCADANGIIAPAALTFFADMALAAAARTHVDPRVRTATLLLRVEFTGAPAHGPLVAEAHSEGFSRRTALPQASATGCVLAAGAEVVRMHGVWVSPPTPEGRTLSALPWESNEPIHYPEVGEAQFDASERAVMKRVEQAIRNAGPEGFLPHFWSPTVRQAAHGAASRIALGGHMGNRVGHVQGGLTMHVALATAAAAVPRHPVLTGASAWYISPGEGKTLTARARVLQSGRNVAVVRTEVFAAGRKLVLEVISNHAVPAHG